MSGTAVGVGIVGRALLCGLGVLSGYAVRVAAAEPPSPAAAAAAPAEAGKNSASSAAELPHLQPGLWEYRRTVLNGSAGKPPQASELKKCSDPTAEFRQKMADLEKKGCHFSPTQRRPEGYVSNWTCVTSSGLVQFHDVLIVQSDTSYQDVIEARSGQQVVRSTIDAQRVDECPASDAGNLPRSQHKKPPFVPKPNP